MYFLSIKGAFTPSGYFLKAVFLHSGEAVSRYSDPLYDDEPTRIASFELLSHPVDVFQGRALHLRHSMFFDGCLLAGTISYVLHLGVLNDLLYMPSPSINYDS